MNGGKDFEAGHQRHVVPVQVPIGWQRKAEPSKGVIYVSPSGSVLASYDHVRAYLLTDGTCKCGLECPLILHKVFNFDPGAPVKQRTAEDVRSDEDVTKLCIHKRKLLAVAALCRSIETHPALTPAGPGGVTGAAATIAPHSTPRRAIRTTPHAGPPNHAGPDCRNPFSMMLAAGHQHPQQRPYPPSGAAAARPGELYPGYPRQHRLGNADAGPKSPYAVGYGGVLGPPPPGSKPYGDGPCSPTADALGSPDGLPGRYRTGQCGFPGAASVHGNGRTPLSPAGQPACAVTGRTSTPLSPAASAKSPVANASRGAVRHGTDVPRAAFHHQPRPTPHPGPPPQASPPPSCALQKRLMTSSEKDPLGILDPIPGKPVGPSAAGSPNPSSFQPCLCSQVPTMNVGVGPPAIVPLPSNLPVPTGKSGPVGHMGPVQRSKQAGLAPSMSPSPVTSPVHASGGPHRSRPPSTSLDHGNFAMPSGHQAHPGSMKVPSPPRSAVGSPLPAVPSSPSSNKADLLHRYIDSQMLSGMAHSVGAQQHNNPVYSATSSSSSLSTQSASQKGHPGLLGMPLNQILNQQKAASFPASSLLSAAAKAQLAYQNKHAAADNGPAAVSGGLGNALPQGGGCGGANEAGGRQPGFLSSPRGMEGHSTSNPMLPPNSATLPNAAEAQSGRAALRDKLMAQQRDPLRKRKQPPGPAPLANHDGGDGAAYGALSNPGAGGPRGPGPCGPADPPRQGARVGGLPPNTSMAQLLQSMSHQGSHLMAGAVGPPGADPLRCVEGPGMGVSRGPPQHLLAQQRPRGPGALPHRHNMDEAPGGQLGPRPHPQHHPGQEMMTQMRASPSPGNRVPARPGDGVPLGHAGPHPPPLSHPGPPAPQQQSLLLHSVRRPNMAAMTRTAGDGSCGPVSTGNPSPLSCSMVAAPQLYQEHQQRQQFQQRSGPPRPPRPALHPNHPYQGQQRFPDHPPYPDGTDVGPMPCVYQNYQGMMASHGQYGDGRPQRSQRRELLPKGEGPPAGPPGDRAFPGGGGHPEAVDAIYRAVVDAARKGVHVTITAAAVNGTAQAAATGPFAGSVGEPAGPPGAANSAPRGLREAEAPSRGGQAGPPQKAPDPGMGTPEPGADRGDCFGSPGRGTPRGPWDGELQHGGWLDGQGGGNAAVWGGEEFLECSTQVRSGPCAERPAGLAPGPPCPAEVSHDHRQGYPDDGGGYRTFDHVGGQGSARYSELAEQAAELCGRLSGAGPGGLFVSRGGYGGEALGPPRQELTGDDQSPGSSTSLDGPLATGRDYGRYDGRYDGRYGGAAASPSDAKSPSSEEEQRRPDSPYRPGGFRMGEVLWGPLKGFPPWPARLAGDRQVQHPREQVKVEPEKLKTLTHDLGAFDRASKRNRKPGKLNNHLEAAIHEAMSELDKISGTVHQMPSRERQVRPPKPKRRKISR